MGLPILTAQVQLGTIAAGTDDEVTVFVAPHDVVIEKIYLTVGTTVAAGATNYTTITYKSKGTAGTGTDALGTFNTNTGQTTLTAHVPNATTPTANNFISKGEAVTIDKVDTASGDVIDVGCVTVVYRAQPGLNQFIK